MRVVFDFDAVIKNRYSGFFTFGRGLLQGMNSLENPPEMILFYQKKFEQAAGEVLSGLGRWAISSKSYVKMRWLENLWQYSIYPRLDLFTGPFDLFHSFHHLMLPDTEKPKILTVHDLRRYILPDLYKKSKLERFERAVKRSDHFIAVSQATKDDLCKIFNIPGQRVDVVYLACDHGITFLSPDQKNRLRQQIVQEHHIELKKYFIAFSSQDKRKNISRIVEAFCSATSLGRKGISLVIIGRLPNDIQIPEVENVHAIGAVNDVIPWLACSEGLVFASLYEGFGLPILEAFSTLTPVITSDCSSMPEVAGGAAIFVDPYNTDAIADAIIRLYSQPDLKQQLIDAGQEQLHKFSWSKTAEKTVQIYEKLLY